MVRTYVRKTERQMWSSESMELAVQAVVNGQMGYKKASVYYKVPSSTLERYVKKKKNNEQSFVEKTAGKYKLVFSASQEAELVNYLKDIQKRLFGITLKELRELAYELAIKNKLDHPFKDGKAGEDWAKNVMKRHQDLSLRKPEATSGARARGFNKVVVKEFFDLLTKIIDEHQLSAERIFNSDETGITVNPKQLSKVIATKGQRQVAALTSAERGTTVTVEMCISASGCFMPPMLVFPRKRKQREFEVGLPPGGWAENNESGWMTTEIFMRWFVKFIEFSNAKKDKPVLLLVDGHSSHTKNIQVIDAPRENGIIILCFPPHCTHRLQPLDVSAMKPLSKHYEDEVRKWLRLNPGKVDTMFEIAKLFGQAFCVLQI
ncbi:uncharacterized protein [Atheta coriaria]|uniref:uncharacterized protein n=1 Tax=Dalotia coriaria TaxID=877792 RepID=UPI0031F45659